MSVIPFPPRLSPYDRVHRARTAMLAEWEAWLRTNPPSADIANEAAATASASRQIAALVDNLEETAR